MEIDLTFGFWNDKPGLAFSDICLATEMHSWGHGERKMAAEEYDDRLVWDLLATGGDLQTTGSNLNLECAASLFKFVLHTTLYHVMELNHILSA